MRAILYVLGALTELSHSVIDIMCLLHSASFFAVRNRSGWLITECLGVEGSQHAFTVLLRAKVKYGRQFELTTAKLHEFIEEGNALQFGHGRIQHFAVAVGNRRLGKQCIIHDPGVKSGANRGVELKLLEDELQHTDEFLIYKCRPDVNSELCRYVAVQRALSTLGVMNYHLLFKNCEHLAQYCCQVGVNRSSQVVELCLIATRHVCGLTGGLFATVAAWQRQVSPRIILGLGSLGWLSGFIFSRLVLEPILLKIYRNVHDRDNYEQKTKIAMLHLITLDELKLHKKNLNTESFAQLIELKLYLLLVDAFFQCQKELPKNPAVEYAIADCRELMLQYLLHRYRLRTIFTTSFTGFVTDTQLNGIKLLSQHLQEPDNLMRPTPTFFTAIMNVVESLLMSMRKAIVDDKHLTPTNFRLILICKEMTKWLEENVAKNAFWPLHTQHKLAQNLARYGRMISDIESLSEDISESASDDLGEDFSDANVQFTTIDLFLQSEMKKPDVVQLYCLHNEVRQNPVGIFS